MIPNKKLLEYFNQEHNIEKLESLIDESYERLKLIKEPKTEKEYESYFKENKEISENKEANHLLDELVYPKFAELYNINNVKRPKVKVVGKGLFKDLISLQDTGLKHLLCGNIALGSLILAIGAAVPEAVLIGSIPYGIIMAKYLILTKNSGGFIDPFFKKTCYVIQNRKGSFAYALAHELTHSVHGKSNSLLEKVIVGSKLDYLLYFEGLAEVVANDITFELDGGEGDVYRKISCNRRNHHLLNAYHDLCDTLNVKETDRKFHKNQILPKKIYEANMYDVGFSIIEMIKKDKGKKVIGKLIRNEHIGL